MSLPSHPQPPPDDLTALRDELAAKSDLVQSVRKELILSQITVLELQDTVLQKETDKADAISILAQAELVLEGKINYIFELDRVLNEKIAQLQSNLAQARAAHANRTEELNLLVTQLDQANRDLGAAHSLAARYAREADEARDANSAVGRSAEVARAQLAECDNLLSTARADAASTREQWQQEVASRQALANELAKLHASLTWKLTASLRWIGHLFS